MQLSVSHAPLQRAVCGLLLLVCRVLGLCGINERRQPLEAYGQPGVEGIKMKRWVVGLLVLLAVVILVSPGIVGHLAEQNLKNSISWAESESDDFLVTEEKFDRGWFTAEGRHRIELKHGEVRSSIIKLIGDAAGDDIPALIVDTRIDHGLVPITSMSRKSGSLMPGLASTVSTLQLDPGDGNLVAIPGTLYSQIRLSGGTVSRYLLTAGSFEGDDVEVGWQGADLSMTADPPRRRLQYHGSIDPVSLQTPEESLQLGLVTVEGDVRQTGYGFMVGAVSLNIESLSMGRAAAEEVSTGSIILDAGSNLVEERVSGKTTLTIADVSLPDFGDVDLAMDVSANGLDARSLNAILVELQKAQRADNPDAALAALYPHIEEDLQRLLSAGGELRIDRFDITLPQGEVATRLSFALPESDAAAAFSWAALILALTASADLRIPAALMDLAQTANPESAALISMGILKKDGDSYIVNAQYEKGLLTVNGAPMPIPLPGR
jgi:uncharacterized protein YdgA (DUF945 family)